MFHVVVYLPIACAAPASLFDRRLPEHSATQQQQEATCNRALAASAAAISRAVGCASAIAAGGCNHERSNIMSYK